MRNFAFGEMPSSSALRGGASSRSVASAFDRMQGNQGTRVGLLPILEILRSTTFQLVQPRHRSGHNVRNSAIKEVKQTRL